MRFFTAGRGCEVSSPVEFEFMLANACLIGVVIKHDFILLRIKFSKVMLLC